ncbi:MAG TPA: PLP-dependent aminotransferase family protein [Ktedonobacteraceae bacterium]|jgi:GntR family transcriptional regulator/MocR family aminotransferase|nr:PLP-dependent aminotransferase family protein [Ktedonobacteraceae bacterium]
MPKKRFVEDWTSLELDASVEIPLYRQLYERIRAGILNGQLKAGTRLPATRTLAEQLGISRNTVTNAYEQLLAEGYITGKVGFGTTVAGVLPETYMRVSTTRISARKIIPPASSLALSRRGQLFASTPHIPDAPGMLQGVVRPFRSGAPGLDMFPYDTWTQLITRHLKQDLPSVSLYQETAGYRPLREAIASYLGVSRGVYCVADQVIIVSGSQGGLDLAARMLLDPGESAWMEDPGYPGARGALLGAGANVVAVPVDDEGLDVEAGQRLAPDARVVSVTPSHQFPLGVTMSLARRLSLLEWAKRTNAWILEDDYDSEYRFCGRPLAALQGLDTAGRVIYIGTFSKVMFPSLRLGYLVVPSELARNFAHARRFIDTHSPILEQLALTDFLNEGHFMRHIRRMRTLYASRRTYLTQLLQDEMADMLEVDALEAGMTLIGWLPEGVDDQLVARQAADYGVDVIPLSFFYAYPPVRGGLLFGYAAFDEQEIREGVRRLKEAIHAVGK